MTSRLPPKLGRILHVLCDACDREGTDVISYASEWLGWLPYGAYHWIDIGTQTGVEDRFSDEWGVGDLDALVDAGCLERLEVVESGVDPKDLHVTYRLTSCGRSMAGGGVE